MPRSYWQIAKKEKNCPINNQPSYTYFISNEFIDFSVSIWIFWIYFTFMKVFSKIFKNERNVTNFGYVVGISFYITHKNFQGDWVNSCTVVASILFKNDIFVNVKKIEKIRMRSQKSINLFEIKKRLDYLITY